MPWMIPAAIIGSAVVGAGVSAVGSSRAARASQAATDSTNATNKAIYDTTRADLAPYNQAGQSANAALMSRYGLSAPTTAPNAYADPAGAEAAAANPGQTGQPVRRAFDAGVGDGTGLGAVAGAAGSNIAANAYAAPQSGYAAPAAGAEPGTYGDVAAPSYTAPVYQDPGKFSYTAADYTQSPGYQFQLDRGLDAIQSSQASRGAMYSGATQKALLKFSQGLAAQDFNQERSAAETTFNTTANRTRSNFDVDANRARANFDADRGYLTDRFDTTTGVLQNLSSSGQNAAAQTGNAGNAYAAATGAANSSNAANVGNAALSNASNINGVISTGLNAYAYGQGQAPGVVNSLATGGAVPRTAYVPYNNRTYAA